MGRARALEAVRTHPEIRRLKLPDSSAQQYSEQIFDGLMIQLRSVPIGLRIDEWLATAYPELRELQHAFALRQLQDNQQVLGADVRRLAVPPIYAASIAMNGAFAGYWACALDQPSFSVPYKATGFRSGEDLLALWDAIDRHPTHDRDLIETWAEKLELQGWFEWVPYVLDHGSAA